MVEGPAAVEGPAEAVPVAEEPAIAGLATEKPVAVGEGPAARGVGPWSTRGLKE